MRPFASWNEGSQSDKSGLKTAVQIIDKFIKQDESFPDMAYLIQGSKVSDKYQKDVEFNRFNIRIKAILPPPVQELCSLIDYRSSRGLFPEINRVWITADNRLLLWNYEDQSDFFLFDDLNQVVVSVGLVKPRRGVFLDDVKYLLVISTPVEVFLMAIFMADDQIRLQPTKFITTTDNVIMDKVVATHHGRIFLVGRNGSLYEFLYQAEDGWFSRRCHLKNHTSSILSKFVPNYLKFNLFSVDPIVDVAVDDSRHILYTVTRSSAISVYDLGISGFDMKLVKYHKDIVHELSLVASFQDQAPESFSISRIFPVFWSDSSYIHLVAITRSGLRLYFSSFSQPSQIRNDLTARPNSLDLVHIKFPPEKSSNVEVALYSNGTFLYGTANQDGTDSLVSIDTNSKQFVHIPANYVLMEFASCAALGTLIYEIAQIPMPFKIKPDIWLLFDNVPSNELVVQHALPTQEYLCLTSSGVYIVEKMRPVDELAHYLKTGGGSETLQLSQFSNRYGMLQMLSMCFQMACDAENPLNGAAFSYLLRLGGCPTIAPRDPIGLNHSDSNGGTRVQFSHLHDALALYFSRLLHPIWMANIFGDVCGDMRCHFRPSQLQYIKQHLQNLDIFLSANHHFTQDDTLVAEETHKAELVSLKFLKKLLTCSIQTINFLEILCNIDLDRASLDPTTKTSLMSLKFRDFLTMEDSPLIRKLIDNLISEYPTRLDAQSVNNLALELRNQCPQFFTEMDAKRFKAYNLLQKAKSPFLDAESRNYQLKLAVQQFIEISGKLSTSLREICETLQFLRYYEGVVSLSLACSQAIDPENEAWSWFVNGRHKNEESGLMAFNKRIECYLPILQVLDELYSDTYRNANEDAIENPFEDDVQDDQKFGSTLKRPALQNLIQHQIRIIRQCIESTDELWHVRLYQWYLDRNMAADLIKLVTPYLETFLKLYCDPPDIRLRLLWQYYLNREEIENSARTLFQMTKMPGLNLYERIEALTKAYSLIQGQSNADEYFLKEIKDTLNVARIQHKIYMEIEMLQDPQLIAQIRVRLDKKLYSITELFNEYSKPYGLRETALAIFYESKTYDTKLIRKLWESMIEEYLIPVKQGENESQALNMLSNKLSQLAGEYYPDQYLFPLLFLIDLLEKNLCEIAMTLRRSQWYHGWIVDSLLKSGVIQYSVIFNVYQELQMSKSSYWQGKNQLIYLSTVICHLLNSWKSSTSKKSQTLLFNSKPVRITIDRNLELLKRYGDNSSSVGNLIEKFRCLRSMCNTSNSIPFET